MKRNLLIATLCLFVLSCKSSPQEDSNLAYQPDWNPYTWNTKEVKGNMKMAITKTNMVDSYLYQTLEWCDTTYYNSFGKITKSSDGTTYTYNDNNQLAEVASTSTLQEYDAATDDFIYTKIPTTITYTYNEAELVAKEESFYNGKNDITYTYTYDEKNRILTQTESTDTYTTKRAYTYGKNTIQLSVQIAGIDVEGSEKYLWTYDDQGRKIKEDYTVTTVERETTTSSSYHYNSKNQLAEIKGEYAITRYKYDDQGNVIEYTETDSESGETTKQVKLSYDKFGNCTSYYEKSKSFDLESTTKHTITYE